MDKEKGIKVDISNTNPEYWEKVLADMGMPEEFSDTKKANSRQKKTPDTEIETYTFPKTADDEEIDPTGCQGCNPKKMHFKGCCSGEVARSIGRRVRSIKDLTDGVIYEICEALKVDETGIWGCEAYFERPNKCKAFDCDDSIAKRLEVELEDE